MRSSTLRQRTNGAHPKTYERMDALVNNLTGPRNVIDDTTLDQWISFINRCEADVILTDYDNEALAKQV